VLSYPPALLSALLFPASDMPPCPEVVRTLCWPLLHPFAYCSALPFPLCQCMGLQKKYLELFYFDLFKYFSALALVLFP
jgi:hypothetical protein